MKFSTGNFPIDLVVLALLAGFLILRLRSVLGKKTGFEQHKLNSMVPSLHDKKNNETAKVFEENKATPEQIIPSSDSEIGQILTKIAEEAPDFVAKNFLNGVSSVFVKVLTAYANEDLDTLKTFLITHTYQLYEDNIHKRRENKQKLHIDVKSILSLEITNASIINDAAIRKAVIEVKIISNQINCTFNEAKEPIEGTESLTEFIDVWIFERILNITTQGPSWRLQSTRRK